MRDAAGVVNRDQALRATDRASRSLAIARRLVPTCTGRNDPKQPFPQSQETFIAGWTEERLDGSMVTVSYNATQQMKRLSSLERRDLQRILESGDLQTETVESDAPGRFVS